jgi:SAM-dependent methyltransferase
MAMHVVASGDYPIERRAGEVERLAAQDAALAEETRALFDRIGVAPGWSCIDLGCGPRGVTHELSMRVGPAGRVVGLEYDPAFVEIARAAAPANAEYLVGDAYATGLPAGSFDLAHVRYVASTAGEPERLVAEAVRLTRPGGVVAFQEADFRTLCSHPPNPAFAALATALASCFPEADGEPIAQRLYRLLRWAGLEAVAYRPRLIGVRSQDPWRDYLPATIDSLRGRIAERRLVPEGALDDLLAACRRHLADPDTTFTSTTLVQVWGMVPGLG